ncbi:MAG: hypothetical protein ACPGGA_06460, partial [Balneolaceae bacterium]
IRVTAQLIKADDGFHIWSENFDGEMKDIFEVQDEISQKIVEKLEADSYFDKSNKLYEASTDSIVAYNHYLEGLFYWNKRNPESVRKAITLFDKAVNYCTTYTNAYSALANCYTFLGAIGQMSSTEAYANAEEYANKAVELNSTRAASYSALGFVHLFSKWNFEQAEANFRKAITLEPDHIDARIGLGYLYKSLGEYDRMIHHVKAASKLEPLSLPAKVELAKAHIMNQNYETSLQIFDEVLELDPMFRMAYEGKSMTYLEMGDLESAWVFANKYLELVKDPNAGGAFLGYISALRGDTEGVNSNLERLTNRIKDNSELDLSIDFACVYAGLNEFDTAFKYLNDGVDNHLGAMVFLDAMLPFKRMTNDPRFQQIRERIGLPKMKVAAA